MENYAFFSSFWFTWSPVSKLVWILLLNSINKAFLLNISAAFELFCCDDSMLKGEKWSVHLGGGLLLKKNMTASDCVKMCPVCNIALSYFCCLLSELTFSTRGSETERWSVSALSGTCDYLTGWVKPALLWMTRLRRRKIERAGIETS